MSGFDLDWIRRGGVQALAKHPGRSASGGAARDAYLAGLKAEADRRANIAGNGLRQIVFKEISNATTKDQAMRLAEYIAHKTEGNELLNEYGFPEKPEEWRDTVGDWSVDFRDKAPQGLPRNVGHYQVSLPEGMAVDAFQKAVWTFLQETFSDKYSYLIGLHRDTNNPHIHIALHRNGRDGKALHIDDQQVERWRVDIAQHCQREGLNVDASPRHERGITTKSPSSEVYHMIKRGENPRAAMARVDPKKLKAREVFQLNRILKAQGEYRLVAELMREAFGNTSTAKALDKQADKLGKVADRGTGIER